MTHRETKQTIERQYSGFYGVGTAVACVVCASIFLCGVFTFHFSRTLSAVFSILTFPLLSFQKVRFFMDHDRITVKKSPLLLPFLARSRTIMVRDVASYHVFDMDRGTKLEGQHYKLRITTKDQETLVVGLYLQGQVEQFVSDVERILPEKRQETSFDVALIRRRQALIKLRFFWGIGFAVFAVAARARCQNAHDHCQ